jgi:FkbM family methyltransferase
MEIKTWYKTEGIKIENPVERLNELHKKINFIGGNLKDEYPEQTFSIKFIKPNAKVLELGANIGRNTVVIATLLDDDKNLVTLECDLDSVKLLNENKTRNNYNFNIEPCALSKIKLIRNGWTTEPSDILKYGYKEVNIITWEELKNKYAIEFDTLVCDCEGALYYILRDFPDFLDNFKHIILENDFLNIEHEIFTFETILSKGFRIEYSEPLFWMNIDKKFFYIYFKKSD